MLINKMIPCFKYLIIPFLILSTSLKAQNSPPLDHWDISFGATLNFSQAYGPWSELIREQVVAQSQINSNIINYQNQFRPGFGLNLEADYSLSPKIILGGGIELNELNLRKNRYVQSRQGNPPLYTEDFDLTHNLAYISPKLKLGTQYKGFTFSGGLKLNLLIDGASRKATVSTAPPTGTAIVAGGTGALVEDQPYQTDPDIPGNIYLPADNPTSPIGPLRYNYGFNSSTISTYIEVKYRLATHRRSPYFLIGYQIALNPYKRTYNAFWDSFNEQTSYPASELNTVSKWHSFSIGLGYTFL